MGSYCERTGQNPNPTCGGVGCFADVDKPGFTFADCCLPAKLFQPREQFSLTFAQIQNISSALAAAAPAPALVTRPPTTSTTTPAPTPPAGTLPTVDTDFKGSVTVKALGVTTVQIETSMKAVLATHFGVPAANVVLNVTQTDGSYSVSYTITAPAASVASVASKATALAANTAALENQIKDNLTAAGVDASAVEVSGFTVMMEVGGQLRPVPRGNTTTPLIGSTSEGGPGSASKAISAHSKTTLVAILTLPLAFMA